MPPTGWRGSGSGNARTPERHIEDALLRLEAQGYIRRWAVRFRRPGETTEDAAAEIRAALFDLLLRRPDVIGNGAGYFFRAVKNHFTNLTRRSSRDDQRCEFYEPEVIEATVSAAPEVQMQRDTSVIRALRTAALVLVEALLDAPRHRSSGQVNHAAVAAVLGVARTTYNRRLARLREVVWQRDGESYQASLF